MLAVPPSIVEVARSGNAALMKVMVSVGIVCALLAEKSKHVPRRAAPRRAKSDIAPACSAPRRAKSDIAPKAGLNKEPLIRSPLLRGP